MNDILNFLKYATQSVSIFWASITVLMIILGFIHYTIIDSLNIIVCIVKELKKK